MNVKTYDTKSYDLAEAFLQDEGAFNTEANRDLLAKAIQTAIEDWIEYSQTPCDMCGEARGLGAHKICHQIP